MALLTLALIIPSATLLAQGCSQCRDTVSQTNPEQQKSYRTAIGIMLAGGIGAMCAGVFAIRRFGR